MNSIPGTFTLRPVDRPQTSNPERGIDSVRRRKRTPVQMGRQESLEARAAELHRQYPVILIHDHEPLGDDLEKCRRAGITGKVLLPVLDVIMHGDPFATGPVLEGWADHARSEFRKTLAAIQATRGQAFQATCAQDFRYAHREGKLAVLLGSEGGKLIEGSLARLTEFYQMGYRCMQLTWNFPNHLIQPTGPAGESELTAFGRELIRELNRLGIIVDVAHAGRRAGHQVLELSAHPVLLSHGGARGAIRRSRHPDWNRYRDVSFVDDEFLRLLAGTGGLLGINFYGPLFFEDAQGVADTTVSDVADHFQYVAETVGVEVLALGCDYFPTDGAWSALLPRQDATHDHFVLPKDRLPLLTAELLARGWGNEDIGKVLSGNFLRLCERVLRQDTEMPRAPGPAGDGSTRARETSSDIVQ